MMVSVLLILLVAAGGFALTYTIESDGPFLWRAAAGLVIGSSIYGTLSFVIGCFAGLAIASPLALAITLVPLLLFRDRERWRRSKIDWQRANKQNAGRVVGQISAVRILRVLFSALLLFLFAGDVSDAGRNIYRRIEQPWRSAVSSRGDLWLYGRR